MVVQRFFLSPIFISFRFFSSLPSVVEDDVPTHQNLEAIDQETHQPPIITRIFQLRPDIAHQNMMMDSADVISKENFAIWYSSVGATMHGKISTVVIFVNILHFNTNIFHVLVGFWRINW